MSQSFGGSKPGLAQAVAHGCYGVLSWLLWRTLFGVLFVYVCNLFIDLFTVVIFALDASRASFLYHM